MAIEPRRRFRFLKELAEGSFGKVYLSEMVTGDAFSTVVAIKLLHGKWLGHEEIVMRARDEARLLGLLRHPHIVRVEDLTSINAQCAVIMEYLEGVDLKTLMQVLTDKGTRFPFRAVFEITSAIASALHAAYNLEPLQGGAPLRVIHRDIKPSNVMVTAAGEVKVLDFGTAHANFDDREAKTQALAFGSQAYMAPERVAGDPDAPSSDVFSLGISLYELITLQRFGPIHIREGKYRKRIEELLPLMPFGSLREPLGTQARDFFARMIDFNPELRPSASEIVDSMEEFSEQADDMGLRRFCKLFVPEGMSLHAPFQTPGDPLTGSTVYEDASSAFGTMLTEDAGLASDPRPLHRHQPEDGPFAVPPELDAGESAPPPPTGARSRGRRKSTDSTYPGPFGNFLSQEAIDPQVATPTIVGLLPEDMAPLPEPPPEPEPVVLPTDASGPAPAFSSRVAASEPPPPVESSAPPVLSAMPAHPAPPAMPAPPAPPVSVAAPPPPPPPAPAVVPPPPPAEPFVPPAAAQVAPPAPPPAPVPVAAPPARSEVLAWEPAGPIVGVRQGEPERIVPVAPKPEMPPAQEEPQEYEELPAPRKSSKLIMVVVTLVTALVVAGGGGAALFFILGGKDSEGKGTSSEPSDQVPKTSEPDQAGRPAQPGEGGNLVLLLDPPATASVSITSLLGYRKEWDGSGKLELKDLPNGAYKTRINPKSGTSVRSTVEVVQGKTCRYKYVIASGKEEWENLGCE